MIFLLLVKDDLSSEATSSYSYTTSSSLISSRDNVDSGSVRSSLLEEFSPGEMKSDYR